MLFPGATQPRRNVRKIPGSKGYDKHPLDWKSQGAGGLKQKCPLSGRGMDILQNYTVCAHLGTTVNEIQILLQFVLLSFKSRIV